MIEISNRLEILPGNLIIVPGCEPTSAITSPTLLRELSCGITPAVRLADALVAIPGATVDVVLNTGGRGAKWLVLPPSTPGCPCQPVDDWYGVLRALPRIESPEVSVDDACRLHYGLGVCQPGVERSATNDTYFREGVLPLGVYGNVNY